MGEITVNQEFKKLVSDCRAILINAVKKTRKEILEGHYLLGKRIIEYKTMVADVGEPLNYEQLAEHLEIRHQRISEIMAYVEWVDKTYGSFEGLLKYYEKYDELPPWSEIVHWYLPFGMRPELEDNRLVEHEIPASKFSNEEEAKKWYEDNNGQYEGHFYKGKIPKNRK